MKDKRLKQALKKPLPKHPRTILEADQKPVVESRRRFERPTTITRLGGLVELKVR